MFDVPVTLPVSLALDSTRSMKYHMPSLLVIAKDSSSSDVAYCPSAIDGLL